MQRKARLRKRLREFKVDGILITDLINVRYLSGFTGSSAYLLITQQKSLFVTDFRYQEQAQTEVTGFTIKTEHSERSGEIAGLIRAYRIKKLGFEDHHMTVGFYNKLRKKGVRLTPLTDAVESLRIIKSREELFCLKKAVKRAERAFKRLQHYIKLGVTEQNLARRLEGYLKEEGCKLLPFGVIVASGPMSALPHASPTNRAIRKGDLIVFDWGGEYNGYYSDMTRTLLLKGKNNARQHEIYSIVLEAQKKAIHSARAGIKASHIDAAARDYINRSGYEECFGHGTGHGVGCVVHEKPYVSWRSRDIIKENMVFTIEPGVYVPDFGGVRLEDMVVARKSDVEILTSLPKRLKVL